MFEKCPSCERMVNSAGWHCPYCDEDLRWRWRAHLWLHREMLQFVVCALVGRCFEADWLPYVGLGVEWVWKKRHSPMMWGLGVLTLWSLVDPTMRWNVGLLWEKHGYALGSLAVAVYVLGKKPLEGGVASDLWRERWLLKSVTVAIDVVLLGIALWILWG